MKPLSILVLAAGKGKRMGNPDLPKVMALLDNRPLISFVLDQTHELHPYKVVVIVGHHGSMVQDFVASVLPEAECAWQNEQLGTGHAVMQAKANLADIPSDVLILSGDVPLIRASTLAGLVQAHRDSHSAATVLSCIMPDPTGYGRIVRDAASAFTAIVEQRDASVEQQSIREVNSGIYVVDSVALFEALDDVRNSNAQNEFYLTDVIGILRDRGQKVTAVSTERYEELLGINTVNELEQVARHLSNRSND